MQEELYLTFENYLQNMLSPEDKTAFENQLQSDVDFNEKFEIYKASTDFMAHTFSAKTADFKANLKSISKTHFKKNKPKVIKENRSKVIVFKPWQYAVAASVAVLFGVFFFNHGNPEYGDFNQHENAFFTERGDVNADLTQAEEAFNAKKYNEAIPFFEAVLKVNNSPEVQYYYGVSLLEDNKIAASEAVFTALKSGNSVYKTKSVWSLALVKLKQEDYKSCKAILQTIPADYEDYENVQKLLNALD
jgi:tetratricopeptide (TPR) repeat protein